MLGKGAKRKLDEDEDGLAERGPESDTTAKLSYSLQRQTVFNMSLMKLYQPRAVAEPSLQRRVLVSNVLRRIQEELKQEGASRPLFLPPDSTLDDAFREAQPAFGVLTPPSDTGLTPASLLEEDPFPFYTSPRLPSPPIKDSFSSALDDIEELCPTQNVNSTSSSSSPFLSATSSPSPDSKESRTCSQRSEGSSLLDGISSLSSSGFLTDLALDDILFADIDTSMYDFDTCSSSAGSSSKAVSMVTADDLLRTLSPYSATASPTSGQPFKMDLAELDHIMEVLVGS